MRPASAPDIIGASTRCAGSLRWRSSCNHLGLAYALRIHAEIQGDWAWRMVDHLGHSTVILFFVLSGYVLQGSYNATVDFTYLSYLLKRLIRIYPALLGALALAWLLYVQAGVPRVDEAVLTLVDLARHAALLNMRGSDIALDTPIWSLAYEIRFSLVFPVLAYLIVRWPNVTLAALFGVHLIAAALLSGGDPILILGYGRIRALAITVYYLICFGLGMYACRFLSGRELPPPPPTAEFLIVATLVAILLAVRNEFVCALAGLGLIILCLSPRSRRGGFLSTPALLRLGTISYSLYLLHVIVLNAVLSSPLAAWPYVVTVGTVVIGSLALASVSYLLIERPGMALGRRVVGAARVTPN